MNSRGRGNDCPACVTALRLPRISSIGLILAHSAWADGCDANFMHSYNRATRYVSALPVDKPGQMRVVATDGAVYTAGEVLWLESHLRAVAKTCSAASYEVAADRLDRIQLMLQSHRARLPIWTTGHQLAPSLSERSVNSPEPAAAKVACTAAAQSTDRQNL